MVTTFIRLEAKEGIMTQSTAESPTALAERRLAVELLDAALKLLGESTEEIQTKLRELGWDVSNRRRVIEKYIRRFLRPDFSISEDRVHYISRNLEMLWAPLDSLPPPIVQFMAENP